MKNPRVSVIIPAFNEAKVIQRLLKSIQSQTYKNVEILVIDDASTDDTAAVAKKFAKAVYTRSHAERSVQRNFGAKKSTGDYLFFLDADMELSKDVVSQAVSLALSDKNIGAIVIPEQSVAVTFWEKVKAFERSFYNEEGDNITDAARFFTKKAFQEANGYDEKITGPEDWDLPETVKQHGFKIGRIKSLIYHYERIKGPMAIAKKKYYYALKSHRYLKKQKIGAIGPKTLYFLRPVFYKKFYKFFQHPVLAFGMIVMLSLELILGGTGYVIGKYKNL